MDGVIQYTIRPYDTIWMLAQVFNTTVDAIMELNPGINPRNLYVGQVIKVRPGYSFAPEQPTTPRRGMIPPGRGMTAPGRREITPGRGQMQPTPTTPGVGTIPPSGGTMQPGTRITPPSGGTTQPPSGTTPSGMTPSGAGMTQPRTGTTPSGGGTTPPRTGTTPPGGGMTQPGTGMTPSGAGMTQPGAGMTMPPSGTTQPGAGMTPPRTGTTPPGAGMTMPPSGTTQPGAGMTPPRTGTTPSGGGAAPSGQSMTLPSDVVLPDNVGNYDNMNYFGDLFNNFPSMDDMDGVAEDLEDLRDYFRLLWEQHVYWTRMAVMGILHDLPEAQLIQQRLLRNPMDFANALMPFYGEVAAKEFNQLLTDHLTIAAEIVNAAKAGDTNKVQDADKRWHDNADKIAELLGSINPYWTSDDWSAMLDEHLQLLSDNVMMMVNENYEESINTFDEIETQALEMADMMADGIAMQFSEM